VPDGIKLGKLAGRVGAVPGGEVLCLQDDEIGRQRAHGTALFDGPGDPVGGMVG
jgi:hypothetical protein